MESWSDGVVESWSVESWSRGVVEWWSGGVVESWSRGGVVSGGVMEMEWWWSSGSRSDRGRSWCKCCWIR